MLYRVTRVHPNASVREPGGALHVPRAKQGRGRHDIPDLCGVLYASRSPISAVAERIIRFRGAILEDADLRRPDGSFDVLLAIDGERVGPIIDLDEPREMARRGLRPSTVATRARTPTQELARAIYKEGGPGFAWWSTIEAAWSNVTLFAERVGRSARVAVKPQALTVDHPAVVEAADLTGVRIARRS